MGSSMTIVKTKHGFPHRVHMECKGKNRGLLYFGMMSLGSMFRLCRKARSIVLFTNQMERYGDYNVYRNPTRCHCWHT